MVEFCEFSVYGVGDYEITDGEDVNNKVATFVKERVSPLASQLENDDDIILVRVNDNKVSVGWWIGEEIITDWDFYNEVV